MMVKNTPELYIFTHLTYTFLTNRKLLPDKRLTYYKYKYVYVKPVFPYQARQTKFINMYFICN